MFDFDLWGILNMRASKERKQAKKRLMEMNKKKKREAKHDKKGVK